MWSRVESCGPVITSTVLWCAMCYVVGLLVVILQRGMDDSAVSYVHGFMPSGGMSTNTRCWFLRGGSKATRLVGLCALCPARILSFCGCRWTCACGFASRETSDVVFSQRPGTFEAGATVRQFWSRLFIFWQITSKLEGAFLSIELTEFDIRPFVARVLVR